MQFSIDVQCFSYLDGLDFNDKFLIYAKHFVNKLTTYLQFEVYRKPFQKVNFAQYEFPDTLVQLFFLHVSQPFSHSAEENCDVWSRKR